MFWSLLCQLLCVEYIDSSLCCGCCQEWKVFLDLLPLKNVSILSMSKLRMEMSQTYHSMQRQLWTTGDDTEALRCTRKNGSQCFSQLGESHFKQPCGTRYRTPIIYCIFLTYNQWKKMHLKLKTEYVNRYTTLIISYKNYVQFLDLKSP